MHEVFLVPLVAEAAVEVVEVEFGEEAGQR
jgi:hypothetical protein